MGFLNFVFFVFIKDYLPLISSYNNFKILTNMQIKKLYFFFEFSSLKNLNLRIRNISYYKFRAYSYYKNQIFIYLEICNSFEFYLINQFHLIVIHLNFTILLVFTNKIISRNINPILVHFNTRWTIFYNFFFHTLKFILHHSLL